MKDTPLALIAAVEIPTMGIGSNGDMLYHISADLRRFKALTMGHAVVMGRKTWESIGSKPLSGRDNYVVSHDPGFKPEGAKVLSTPENAEHIAASDKEIMVMGGQQIYEALIDRADTLYITQIFAPEGAPEPDRFFPPIDLDVWEMTDVSAQDVDPRTGARFRFVTYRRK